MEISIANIPTEILYKIFALVTTSSPFDKSKSSSEWTAVCREWYEIGKSRSFHNYVFETIDFDNYDKAQLCFNLAVQKQDLFICQCLYLKYFKCGELYSNRFDTIYYSNAISAFCGDKSNYIFGKWYISLSNDKRLTSKNFITEAVLLNSRMDHVCVLMQFMDESHYNSIPHHSMQACINKRLSQHSNLEFFKCLLEKIPRKEVRSVVKLILVLITQSSTAIYRDTLKMLFDNMMKKCISCDKFYLVLRLVAKDNMFHPYIIPFINDLAKDCRTSSKHIYDLIDSNTDSPEFSKEKFTRMVCEIKKTDQAWQQICLDRIFMWIKEKVIQGEKLGYCRILIESELSTMPRFDDRLDELNRTLSKSERKEALSTETCIFKRYIDSILLKIKRDKDATNDMYQYDLQLYYALETSKYVI